MSHVPLCRMRWPSVVSSSTICLSGIIWASSSFEFAPSECLPESFQLNTFLLLLLVLNLGPLSSSSILFCSRRFERIFALSLDFFSDALSDPCCLDLFSSFFPSVPVAISGWWTCIYCSIRSYSSVGRPSNVRRSESIVLADVALRLFKRSTAAAVTSFPGNPQNTGCCLNWS